MLDLPSQLWWWVARATGIVAWVMATAAVVWGLALSARLGRHKKLPAWLLDLHRYLGTLTLAFVAVHLIALVADDYVDFGLRELFVPMGSAWRPGAVTWGVLALYGLVVVEVTSWAMRRLPRRVWHGIHGTSYLVFVAATVHGALAGADRDHPWLRVLAAAGVLLVAGLTVARVVRGRNPAEPAPHIAAARARLVGAAPVPDPEPAAPLRLGDLAPPAPTDRLDHNPAPASPSAILGR